jgi:hypothetical protein
VVALARGGLPEVIDPGVTGYLAADEGELTALVARAPGLDRPVVRARAAARFDLPVVAARYREIYHEIIEQATKESSSINRSTST